MCIDNEGMIDARGPVNFCDVYVDYSGTDQEHIDHMPRRYLDLKARRTLDH